MKTPLTVTCNVHFNLKAKGRKHLRVGVVPIRPANPPGRVPRIAKLMALAIRFDGLIRTGVVRDYAGLARLGHVTRARITQIMNLLQLAPDLQEQILFLPPTVHGRDAIILRELQPIASKADWKKQRSLWQQLAQPFRRDR
jgi:hypothetical protein